MLNSLVPGIMGRFGPLGWVLALALAVGALTACGGGSAGATPDGMPRATAALAGGGGPTAVAAGSGMSANAAPEFRLSNAAGDTVSLDSYAGRKNVVLIFYRGFW